MMTLNNRYKRSKELFEKVSTVIPLASQTFSKSYIQYPEFAPHFIEKAKGSHVWDVDGNEYIDFINGLLPVILGYCDPDVDSAVINQMKKGVIFSLPSPLEGELAEILVDMIPCAEMVRFGKNGSDATAGAIRVARAYTGRKRLAVCGYHGWQDWYIGSTSRNKGIPDEVKNLTHHFKYNDISSLQALFDKYPGEFAAVIMEPMNIDEPEDGFLNKVKELSHKHGALFILDEIITGFRYHIGGAQSLFGIVPDLATFGKSMANGYPISAVVGKKEFMKEMEEVFFSFTFGGETLSIAASIATIKKIKEYAVIDSLWETGRIIMDNVNKLIEKYHLETIFSIKGKPPWSILKINDHEASSSWEIKTLFMQEMLKRGILISSSHNISFSHAKEDINKLIENYEEVFELIKSSIENGNIKSKLVGQSIRPIFQVR